ncbi:MAG: hypothetical protein KJ634_03350 [Gammaproteobacteria bacterium]|nr:hypothetical protein [Gammaproteobacteria bacterium]MBU1414639.1 hypothetical protein [Gammaproteobacteria bacterium]
MDDDLFRAAHDEVNRLPCVFEKVLLAGAAICECASGRAIAERQLIVCTSPVARVDCGQLSALLREKSAFALRLTSTQRILPHAMMMKIQCGGLLGLRRVLDPGAPLPHVRALILKGRERFGELAALPFSEIVQGVAAFHIRKRRR